MAHKKFLRTIWTFDVKCQGRLLRSVGIVLFISVVWSFYCGIRRSVGEGGKGR